MCTCTFTIIFVNAQVGPPHDIIIIIIKYAKSIIVNGSLVPRPFFL